MSRSPDHAAHPERPDSYEEQPAKDDLKGGRRSSGIPTLISINLKNRLANLEALPRFRDLHHTDRDLAARLSSLDEHRLAPSVLSHLGRTDVRLFQVLHAGVDVSRPNLGDSALEASSVGPLRIPRFREAPR